MPLVPLSLLSSHPSQSYSNQSEFNFKVLTITFALLIQNFQNKKYEHCLVNIFSMISNAKSRANNYKRDSKRVYKIGFNLHDLVGVDRTSITKSQQVSNGFCIGGCCVILDKYYK